MTTQQDVLNTYYVRYWSTVEWSNRNCRIIARSEQQAREWADKECSPEYRKRRDGSDSLLIEHDQSLTLPCILWEL
jgi:hypothetical protein